MLLLRALLAKESASLFKRQAARSSAHHQSKHMNLTAW
jgi:hypothetical protein